MHVLFYKWWKFNAALYHLGSKSIVITQASWLGGRSSFLGIAYLVVGTVCLVVFGVLFYYHRRNPRHLGDVSWLRKALYS